MPTLDWIGKKSVLNHHRQVPYRLLHCDAKLSAGGTPGGAPLLGALCVARHARYVDPKGGALAMRDSARTLFG